MIGFRWAATALLALPVPLAARAQAAPVPVAATPATSDKIVYEGDFFTAFAPQTALDMIARLPGFTLDEGDDRRGFAGAAGNVLIDGARPSAKSQSLGDVLSQIPARQVVRIEVLRNPGGDAQGLALVANVVRQRKDGSGVWRLEADMSSDGRISPIGEASVSTRVAGVELKAGLSRYMEQNPLAGWRASFDGAGVQTGARWDETPRTFREARGNGEAKLDFLGGKLRLNASGGRWNFRTGLLSRGFDPKGAPTDAFTLQINERQRVREIGGDWTRTFGPTRVKLVGLDTRKWYANDEATRTFSSSGTGLVAQKRRNLSSESIGRGTVARTFGAHAFEVGGEAALNRLDANVDLAIDGAPVALPAGDVVVEERRAEAFVADVWTLSPKWTIEARIAGETSELTQTGDTRAKASFSFAKPSIQISRKFGERNQARVRVFRDVGQLNFGDFASSAALGDNRVAAGNPDLRPDTNWRLEAGLDQRFGGKGALSVTAFREWFSDVQDVVPVNGFDAPGNIGNGRTIGVSIKATAPLDRVAKGLTATLDGQWRRGEVTDPTTGRTREPTTYPPYQYTAELRRDDSARKIAYGLRYRKQSEFQFYRVGEVETYEENGDLKVYFETTRIKGAKISLVGANLTNGRRHRERYFYAPDRRGALSSVEERDRQNGPIYAIEVSGSF
jgi:hypothetical protein